VVNRGGVEEPHDPVRLGRMGSCRKEKTRTTRQVQWGGIIIHKTQKAQKREREMTEFSADAAEGSRPPGELNEAGTHEAGALPSGHKNRLDGPRGD